MIIDSVPKKGVAKGQGRSKEVVDMGKVTPSTPEGKNT